MFVRAYLRASTEEQDAFRALADLEQFAAHFGKTIASVYSDNESGVRLDRPDLMRLLRDAKKGDILLIEAIDRLSRLNEENWKSLKRVIDSKGLKIVVRLLPTSHRWMTDEKTDLQTERLLGIINDLLIEIGAAQANADYEVRRYRQAQGIATAKAAGLYKGRPQNIKIKEKVWSCLDSKFSIRKTSDLLGCSPTTVKRYNREWLTTRGTAN
ncbi:DNA invertase Pin-like site-specific DNA recombinase [Pseudomonas duriflava]|uniref:DNA invertase Pin-like site-specific DNA recombinase n=1 Tax=Pseudomonas duriflava TaxID=459528 RepID=A0A562PPB3_9PSED|nr:recombinase family protein [Pseudomonas duriflava]TWI46173.1 DNA invertase Pin-like site-specific DNA recombinase [Pseudomonas duriflava]